MNSFWNLNWALNCNYFNQLCINRFRHVCQILIHFGWKNEITDKRNLIPIRKFKIINFSKCHHVSYLHAGCTE